MFSVPTSPRPQFVFFHSPLPQEQIWTGSLWRTVSSQRDDLTQLCDEGVGPVLLRSLAEVKLIRLIACLEKFALRECGAEIFCKRGI
jgi:hypothetical protein